MNDNKYAVGRAIGIIDPVDGQPAWAIIVDRDSVLCTFKGTRAAERCAAMCKLLNAMQGIADASLMDALS